MDPAAPAQQTLEDLVALRERGQSVELIDGVVVHEASPSFEHGLTLIGSSTPRCGRWSSSATRRTHPSTALTAGGDEVVRAEPFDAIEIPLARLFGRE